MAFLQTDTAKGVPTQCSQHKDGLSPLSSGKKNRKESLKMSSSYDSLRGLRILHADDVRINSLLIKGILEEKGCIVDVVNDGREAFELFLASPVHYYNAILTDIVMPVMNGFEASRQIRALEREDAKCVPIIALTSDYVHYIRNELTDFGIDAGLLKPVRPNTICTALLDLLERDTASV